MPHPRHAQPGRRPRVPERKWVHERQRRRRDAVLIGTEELTHRRPLDTWLEPRRHRISILKDPAVEPRRCQHAFAAEAILYGAAWGHVSNIVPACTPPRLTYATRYDGCAKSRSFASVQPRE